MPDRSPPPIVVAVVWGIALGMAAPIRAHDDPPGCGSTGVAMIVSLFRADGTTGLVGGASECERMSYRVTLQPVSPYACAISEGTLTLATPDGVVHRLQDRMPPIGGTTGLEKFESALVPYAVRDRDVVNGVIKAIARYDGGVAHDNAKDSGGLFATTDRTVPITTCDDTDGCTADRCDPTKANAAACYHEPFCDDGDPLTADACAGGFCVFAPIASSERAACAAGSEAAAPFGVPQDEFAQAAFRGHHAAAATARAAPRRSRTHSHAHEHGHPHPHAHPHPHPHPHE